MKYEWVSYKDIVGKVFYEGSKSKIYWIYKIFSLSNNYYVVIEITDGTSYRNKKSKETVKYYIDTGEWQYNPNINEYHFSQPAEKKIEVGDIIKLKKKYSKSWWSKELRLQVLLF
jgi:hypothetical protein